MFLSILLCLLVRLNNSEMDQELRHKEFDIMDKDKKGI